MDALRTSPRVIDARAGILRIRPEFPKQLAGRLA